MPKVVISGYYGFQNNGDEAMLYAILKALRQRVQGLDVVVLSKDPRGTQEFFGVRAIPRHNLKLIMQELRKADLFVSGGGGLLQDATGPNSILYYLGIVSMARMMGVPVFFYGQGIGPVRSPLGKAFLKLVANGVNSITVRDTGSREQLKLLGVDRPSVTVTADPALGLEMEEVDSSWGSEVLARLGIAGNRPLAGISVRGWKGLNDYKKVLAQVCDRLIARGTEVVFLPMHFPQDVEAAREIISYMEGPCHIIDWQLNFKEMLSLVKNIDIILGMRLHFLIFAAVAGIPMVGVSYDPKVDSFLRQVQMPLGGSIENLDQEQLFACIMEVLKNKEALKVDMAERVALLRQQALMGADLATSLLNRQ